MIGPYLIVLAVILALSVGVVYWSERKKDRRLSDDFNARLDKVLLDE